MKALKVSVISGLVSVGLIAFAPIGFSAEWASKPNWASGDYQNQARAGSGGSGSARYSKPMTPFSPGSNNIALSIGQTFLMGTALEGYNDNLGFRANYTYGVSNLFGFETNVGYSNHSDGDFNMTSLMFGLRTNLAWYDKIVPYISLGLGFFRPELTRRYANGESDTFSGILFGLQLGPGINLQLNDQVFFGTSLTFHDIFGTKETARDGSEVDVGGTYTSFHIHAGMSL